MNTQSLILTLLFAGSISFSQPLLTLQQALQIGSQHNYEIRIARVDERIADTYHTLGNAGFLPSVSVISGYSKSINNTKQSFVNGLAIERDNAETSSRNVSIELNWTLFQGFRRFAQFEQNELDSRIATINKDRVAAATNALITGVYYDIVRQQQTIRVLNDAVELSSDRITLAEGKLNIGSGSQIDVNQAMIDLNIDRVAFLRQQVILNQAKITLNRLLARDDFIEFSVQDSIPIDKKLQLDDLKNHALEKNFDIQRSHLSVARANQMITKEKSARYPVIGFDASWSYFRSQSDAGFLQTNRNNSYTVGIGLNMILFDGFNVRNRIQVAELEAVNRNLELNKARIELLSDLQNLYKQYQNSLTLVEIQALSVRLARENLDIALERYRLGSITSLELRDIQNKYIQAQALYISASYDAKLAETDMLLLSNQSSPAETSK